MVDELRRQDWVPRSVHRDQRLFSQASDRLGQKFGREATDEELRNELNLSPDRFESLAERISSPILVSFDASSEDQEGNPYDLFDSTPAIDQPMPFEQLLLDDDLHVMRECLNTLPDRHRTVLSLHYMEQVLLRDIASLLSVTESRVSQIHSEGLRMLLTEFVRYTH
jgi:RNA polymerase sigma factor for flagellar operon FliA